MGNKVSSQLIDKALEKLDSNSDKQKKKAKEFIEKNRELLEGFGEATLSRFFGLVGMGEQQKAADLLKMRSLIASKSTEELIEGVEESGNEFISADKKAMDEAEAYNAMAKTIGVELSRYILSLLLSVV